MIRDPLIEFFDGAVWRTLEPIGARYIGQDMCEFTYAVDTPPQVDTTPPPRFRVDGRIAAHAFVAYAEAEFVVMRVRLWSNDERNR